MNKPFFNNVISWPKTWVMLCTVFMLITAVGNANLYFRGDYQVFFKEDNPQRLTYENMQSRFTKNESLSILLSTQNGDLFNDKHIRLIKQLTDNSWQVPMSTRVDSITNFQHSYSDNDDLVVEDLLLEEDMLDNTRIALIKAVSLREPDLVNKLISPNGQVTMVNINLLLPDGNQTIAIREIAEYVRNMIAPYQAQHPEITFRLTGIVAFTDAMFSAAIKDATSLFPIMFVVISIMIALLMRSPWATLATLVIVISSIVSTMGVGGWLGMFINIATVNVPIIIMTLAIADSVHLISGMRFYMQNGDSKHNAIVKSLQLNTGPIIMTSVTTAIGFLTLNFAEVPILSDMGNLVALGVIIACVFSLTLLPAVLLLLPIHYEKQQEQSASWQKISQFTITFSRPILLFGVVLIAVSTFFASKNTLNDIPIEYFNKSNEFRQAADFHQDNLSGFSTIDLALYSNIENHVNSLEYLALLENFTTWLKQQPEVDHVLSYSNTIKRLNKNFNGDDNAYYVLPDSRELAAQYLLLYEMSLPFGLDINNQIDLQKSAIRVMVTLKNLGSQDFTAFEDRAKLWIASQAPQYTLEAASIPLIFAHIGKANMNSILQGGALALVLISGLLFVALKSVKLGVISLVPNLLPALMGFGIWALISAEISMALSVVITMTLGIIVDDTVHFLSKYKKALDSGNSPNQAILFAFNNVGNALLITTIVLASGFGILAFSSFAINSDMGTLTAIIIIIALIVDLLLLPAMLAQRKKLNKFAK